MLPRVLEWSPWANSERLEAKTRNAMQTQLFVRADNSMTILLYYEFAITSLGQRRRTAGVNPGNNQDARKSRRIKAESRKKPSPTDNGIAPKEAAIQASGSTRAMSVKVIM